MRRGVGYKAADKKKFADKMYNKKGTEIDKEAVQNLHGSLGELKKKLQWFAAKHQIVLQTDPVFRQEFIQMCASIGVDPINSSKSFWTEYLGVGSYYYMLAVQSIEIILAGAGRHGGVMKLVDLWRKLEKDKPTFLRDTEISFEDIVQAFGQLEVIGNSCGIIKIYEKHIDQAMVYCVPEEMSSDGTKVIKFVAQSGKAFFVTADVAEGLGWEPLRAKTTIDNLIRDGIVWVDIGTMLKHICKMYWLPGLFLTTDAMPDM